MTHIVHAHTLGIFIYDEQLNLISDETHTLNDALRIAQEISKEEVPHRIAKLLKAGARLPTEKEREKIMAALATPQNLARLSEINLRITKDQLMQQVQDDTLIIQAIGLIEELHKTANTLTKRAREWVGFFFPEALFSIPDNEGFIKAVSKKSKEELMQELGLSESIGSPAKDNQELIQFLTAINALYEEKEKLEHYLETVMQRSCPNITAVAGAPIGAKLLKEAGSLQKLATTTSTTVQMLGAEKALFRHLKNKRAPPPKHGHIINHPLLAKAKEKGKVARALADKISIAAKMDYFKGEFIGDRLRKELEEKFRS
jgi:nucleolar protein 56